MRRSALLTTTDSRGKVTTNTYDTLNRLQTSTDPLSRKTTYTYDAGDHVVSITNPLGEQTGGQGEMIVFTLVSLETLRTGGLGKSNSRLQIGS